MQNIAQGYLVFELTKSELWLGIVACAAGLPIILMSPVGGVIVDRIPRRRLMIFTQTIQMILAFILAVLTFAGTVQVWHIVTLAFLLGMTNALDMPARQVFVLEIVGREDLRSGIALNAIMNNVGRILGPTAAGLALVGFGAAWCFLINGVSFLAVLLGLFLMQVPFATECIRQSAPMRQLREGLSFARHDPLIAPLLLLSAVAGLLIIPIMQMMPAFADVVLHSPDEGYAALNVGQGIGAVLAGVMVGSLAQRLGYGRLIVGSLILCALFTVLMALQVTVFLAALMSGIFGLFLILEFVTLNTTLQTITPDTYRGRVLSLYMLGLLGFAPFGALVLGAIASLIGTAAAIILYGVLSAVVGGLIVLRWRNALHYGEREPQTPAEIPEAVRAVGD
jgi:MFS family permease